MDYSLLIVVAAGMMKMATGDNSPFGRVSERGLDWFSVATEACGGGTSDLGFPPGFLEYLGIYRAKKGCGRPLRWAQPTWACQGALSCPGGLCPPRGTPQVLLWPIGSLLVHKKSTKTFMAFGVRLISISCDVKNKQKTASGTGHWVNRLVPKMI